jgi:hypothetical protein
MLMSSVLLDQIVRSLVRTVVAILHGTRTNERFSSGCAVMSYPFQQDGMSIATPTATVNPGHALPAAPAP